MPKTRRIDQQNSHGNTAEEDNVRDNITWKQIIGGTVGNVLEGYDFATFGYLVTEIGNAFFPDDIGSFYKYLYTYGIFCGAFFFSSTWRNNIWLYW